MSEPRVLVIDTSYLVEIYRVPGRFHEAAHAEIVRRLAIELDRGTRCYVPVAVIFELANHVAHVKSGASRRALAKRLADDVRASIDQGVPWIVVPTEDRAILMETAHLLELVDEFATALADQAIGLSDAAVITEARRLKKRPTHPGFPVHIWTREQAMKAHEPDAEPDPFV